MVNIDVAFCARIADEFINDEVRSRRTIYAVCAAILIAVCRRHCRSDDKQRGKTYTRYEHVFDKIHDCPQESPEYSIGVAVCQLL